jgi:hypothetical protein
MKRVNPLLYPTPQEIIMARGNRNEAQAEGNVNAEQGAGAVSGSNAAAGAQSVQGDPLANVDTTNMTAAQRLAHQHALANPKKAKAAKPEGSEESQRQKIMVNDPENGSPIGRQELIKRLWTEDKLSRSQITTVLNDEKVNSTGKKIPYQIVFAATKGVAGGPEQKPGAVPQPNQVAENQDAFKSGSDNVSIG